MKSSFILKVLVHVSLFIPSFALNSKCSALTGFSASASESILYEPGTKGFDLEQCCSACDHWTGLQPCVGYVYDTDTHKCSIKSKIGHLETNLSSTVVIGYPATQKFEFIGNDKTLTPLNSIETYPTVDSRECALHCLKNMRCNSFIIHQGASEQFCQLGESTLEDSSVQLDFLQNTKLYSIMPNYESNTLCETADSGEANGETCLETNTTCIGRGSIVISGGYDGTVNYDTIYKFNPNTGSFVQMEQNLVLNDHGHISGFLDCIYIVIGFVSQYSMVQPLEFMTIALGQTPRRHSCGGAMDGKFYSCFGEDHQNNILSDCDIFTFGNGHDNQLTVEVKKGPTNIPPVLGAACTIKDGHMYVIGGLGPGGTMDRSVFKLDLNTMNHTQLNNCPQPVQLFSSAVWFGGNVVACGGQQDFNECWSYNPVTNGWTLLSPKNLVTGRNQAKLVNWEGDKLLLFGGYGGGVFLSSVELYRNGEWSHFAKMPIAMEAMSVAVAG